MREGGGNCLQYLKRGGTEKRGGDLKILKRVLGQARPSGGSVSVQYWGEVDKQGEVDRNKLSYLLAKLWLCLQKFSY